MTEPSHSSTFEKAIAVNPIGDNTYSAYLDPSWSVGKVPHGGYTASVLYRTAATHFTQLATTKNRWGARSPEPIALQITFQRRTFAGPAILKAQEIKLGARISTIQVTLFQARDERAATAGSKTNAPEKSELEEKVFAFITLAPPVTEEGPAVKGPWGNHLSPAPAPGSLSGGSIDFKALAENGMDGDWKSGPHAPPAIHAAQHLKVYSPSSTLLPKTVEERATQVVDQWVQFTPGGTPARWSNEAVSYLADSFLAGLDRIGAMEETRLVATGESAGPSRDGNAVRLTTNLGLGKFWYPTVTMNIDLKTRLPPQGVEWLHSRVMTRMVRGSRADLEVLIFDQEGELVATSTQIALAVDPTRNTKGRLDGGKL
ncbi:hypothetical protein N7478_004057 [Penicillium angulare]|uniref:uncharacterized protein n=1 Tax=Penicillium angulare TaxID=116970 RepID=UPI00253F79EA|nr:uncharacterized protein N7478_004057 [Penicillium angulare]KAJ5278685.1 hypothetical protein N7478_004057 [Penicillium angulare]